MRIRVNGIDYDSWDDVPADLRALMLRSMPDSDGDGVPDAFSGHWLDKRRSVQINVRHESYPAGQAPSADRPELNGEPPSPNLESPRRRHWWRG